MATPISHAKPVSDAELHKLLDETRLADEELQRAEDALKAATTAKERAMEIRANAHNAVRPQMLTINGPVVYDGYIWTLKMTHVTHERIGRDLTPRQESLLPEPLKVTA